MTSIDTTQNLFDRLNDTIDEISLNEVKQFLASISKINTLKRSISSNFLDGGLYDSFFMELKSECKISNIKIDYVENNKRTLLYKSAENINYEYFLKKTFNKITIEIFIDAHILTEYEILTLSTYCNEISHLFSTYFIIMELKASMTIDPLTQLQNRLSLNNELKRIVPLAIREKMKLGVLLINIDRFRAVNDEHGDDFGDEFLKLYADTLQKCVRDSDITIRFGGGEFLVLLVNVKNIDMTMSIAKKIKDKLTNTYLLSPNNDKFQKTVSVGVAIFPDDSDDILEVIKFTEMALSDAKDTGRNILRRYEKSHKGSIELF